LSTTSASSRGLSDQGDVVAKASSKAIGSARRSVAARIVSSGPAGEQLRARGTLSPAARISA
jgi:hypothetical protein